MKVFGKDEALEIMLKSPMILTCGSDLDSLSPDDIRSTANTRQLLDKVAGPPGLLLVFGVLCLLKVVGGVAATYG